MYDEIMNKQLIVNRIRIANNDDRYEIHINKIDGKRVNKWLKIDKNTELIKDGKPKNWSYIFGNHYYVIRFTIDENTGTVSAKIECELF